MPDLLTTLAERLRTVRSTPVYTWDRIAHDAEQYLEGLAREALAVVAEQLPTREEIAQTIYESDPRTQKWPAWQALDASPQLRDDWFVLADAILRDLRERLGVQE